MNENLIIYRLKKKYIEPYEKLNKNIQNKINIDQTIEIYEKLKNIKADIKMMKMYFEKDNSLLLDSNNTFLCYQRIKKNTSETDYKGFNYIKEELEWFKINDEKIFVCFRNKFHEAIKQMVI